MLGSPGLKHSDRSLASSRPISLVAERAVRYLRDHEGSADSRRLTRELLATQTPNELSARRMLETAFDGDPRLTYDGSGWCLAASSPSTSSPTTAPPVGAARDPERQASALEAAAADTDRALIVLQGARPGRGVPFRLETVAVMRLRGDEVLTACGGTATDDRQGTRLRRAVQSALQGAIPVVHDAPGAWRAFERWLGRPTGIPVSLRRLGRERLGLPALHSLGALASRLGLVWRMTDDPLEQTETIDGCLRGLRRDGETLEAMRGVTEGTSDRLDWSRFVFDRAFLRRIPRLPGTYRFFDAAGELIYVGKSKNLHTRIGSYFRAGERTQRVQRLLARLTRIEYTLAGSDLEAMLREAEQIRRERPDANVQRQVGVRQGRAARLRSILILEPAEPPALLRAYLIRGGRLIARVSIGPRGGGLRRIERLLDDHFFFAPTGPTPASGPDLDVEVVVRWLAAHRDRVVAFDPTDLRAASEVTSRLRWFLDQGSLHDPDGLPRLTR